jgi:hypothetical protein
MRLNLTSSLKKALGQLEMEKQQIDGQITVVHAALRTLGEKGQQRRATTRAKGKRHRMSVAGRRTVSQRMKAYWAKRRAASKKAKG